MSAPCRHRPYRLAFSLWMLAGLTAAAALLAGCGSVGDIGMGASRSGVQPVRGTYGTGSYGGRAGDEEQRVERLAEANHKSKQDRAAVKALKALPDGTSDTVASVSASEQPAVSEAVKVVVTKSEQTAASAPRSRDAYGADRMSFRGQDYDDY